MYGRVIWVARNDTPKITKIRARRPDRPGRRGRHRRPDRGRGRSGMTSGRTSRDPNVTSSAVPTDSTADNQNTAGNDQPRPSIRRPARAGPTANPIGPDAPKIAIVVPSRRIGVTSRMPASMTPVFPSWNPMRSMLRASCHGSRRQRHAGEHHRLDERAAHDDGLAAVLVGPHAPQRHERHPDHEDQRAEEPDEGEPVGFGYAHLAQVGRDEGEDLADTGTLDHRGDPEDGDEDAPVLLRAWSGREGSGSGVTARAYRDRDAGVLHGRRRGRRAGHTKMPEGTGRKPANRPPFGSEQVRSLRVPPVNLARWPCDQRTWLPIPLRGSLPGAVLAVRTCPFGQDEM